jgi:hypothetical protein
MGLLLVTSLTLAWRQGPGRAGPAPPVAGVPSVPPA